MNSLPEVHGARPGVVDRLAPLSGAISRNRYSLTVYGYSRALYLLIAALDALVRHWPLWRALRNWDGKWYVLTAETGYPHVIHHYYTTLGFMPLYPLLIRPLALLWPGTGYVPAGFGIALVTGGIAVVLIGRLAERWWGEEAARRSVLFLCLFPGSIVFSMVYSEGPMLALVAGCLLALEDRRWLLAGVLAGACTAIEPVALAIIPACAAVAGREIVREGWRGRRALLAPLLAPAGAAAFAVFLWFWVGTPLATYDAQRYAWKETSSPGLGLVRAGRTFVQEIEGFRNVHTTPLNMNYPAGILGACFLVWALWLLWRRRTLVSLGALVWTAGVALLTLTSNSTPPNPRLLLCAFPATIAVAASRRTESSWRWLIVITLILTVVMSIDTYVGSGLRP